MPINSIAIPKHKVRRNKTNEISAQSLAIWRGAQYLVLLLGIALLGTLIYRPTTGLNLMWNGLIPLTPALLVIAPGLWRNLCPMATFSLLPHRFGISKRRTMPRRTAGAFAVIALLVLFIVVPLRHLAFDTNAPLTALMLALSAIAAISTGMFFEWRSGWCNALCPIHPVEKLYGQLPAITLPNARCDECRNCSMPCPDSIPAMNPSLTGAAFIEKAAGHILIGGLAGLIWGWYRLPDFHHTATTSEICSAFVWPLGCALVTLAIYAAAYRWIYRSNSERHFLVKLFATAAVCTYYWYRLPALAGFGPNPGTGMLVDLSIDFPLLPLLSRVITTSFFIWFLLLRKHSGASWTRRPVFKPIMATSTHD